MFNMDSCNSRITHDMVGSKMCLYGKKSFLLYFLKVNV